MSTIDLILTLAALPVLACSLYLLTLTLLSVRHNPPLPDADDSTRFRIVVPAHDEEAGIARTLGALGRLDYPESRHQVVVVADNCSDGTADVARACGVQVLERREPELRGKGYALRYAFERLCREPDHEWDAVVVIDADTVVESNLLRAVSARLAQGDDVVQAAYLPTPSDSGTLAMITEVAFTAFHLVRSTARERLGLSVGLRGNGMAFRRKVLEAVPHDAFSRTEDLEFGIHLALTGHRVAFAGETRVYGDMPREEAATSTQRSRWIGGRIEMARAHVPGLLKAGLGRRDRMLVDLAVDLLVPPLSLILVGLVAGTATAALASLVAGRVSPALYLWLVADTALVLHVLDAARRAGRMRELVSSPRTLWAYAVGKARIVVRSLQVADREWIRTPRPGEVR